MRTLPRASEELARTRVAPPRRIEALSVDAELVSGQRAAEGGCIHAVFASVVNVVTSDDELWCLTARHVAEGPRAVRVPLASFVGLALEPGMPVTVSRDVRVGDALVVSVSGAKRWMQRSVHGPVRRDRIHEFEAALTTMGVPGGAQSGDDSFSRAVSERIRLALDGVGAGIRSHDQDAIAHAAARIVGLGTGLTPAGDDVLTGLAFASAQLGGSLAPVPDAVRRAAASGTTHAISLTAMREACRGRAVQPLTELLAALCAPAGAASIPDLTAALIGIGHTSGTDQAHGLLAAVLLTEEMRGK